ncbi:twin-arginine translocation pathway signal protein [Mycolicibacterium monacense]|nr:twin-arginine translocation pathway signal protein [Mycolicibacterium monacense]
MAQHDLGPGIGPLRDATIGRRSLLLLTGAVGAGAVLAACAKPPRPPSAGAIPPMPVYAAALNEQIPPILKENGIPGAIVLIRSPDKGDWSATFGVAGIGSDAPPSLHDHVRIASISKSMTATVILQLQQEGELAITDPISRYVPGVPDGDSITIQQLAEMRSGLYSYADDPEFAATLEKQPDTVWTPQQLLGIAFAHPQNFPPGRQYEYSNTNYVLLGLVIEKVTGRTAAAALKARIFDPLGLRNTMLPAAADAALPDPHPRGYMWGPNEASDGPLPQAQLEAALAGDLQPADHTNDNPSWAWTAGGVISRAEDVADFIEAMVAGPLLDDATRQWRLVNMKPTDLSDPGGASKLGFGTYGFGLEGAGPMYGHPGNIVGFSGLAAHDPKVGTTVVILTTVYLTPRGDSPQNALFAPILSQLYPDVAAQLPGLDSSRSTPPTSSTGPGR